MHLLNTNLQGASIQGIRPGIATRDYITTVLERLSLLGSVFLGLLAGAPALVEATTGLTTFRGFGGTSILILVGVATDSARKARSLSAHSHCIFSRGSFESRDEVVN